MVILYSLLTSLLNYLEANLLNILHFAIKLLNLLYFAINLLSVLYLAGFSSHAYVNLYFYFD